MSKWCTFRLLCKRDDVNEYKTDKSNDATKHEPWTMHRASKRSGLPIETLPPVQAARVADGKVQFCWIMATGAQGLVNSQIAMISQEAMLLSGEYIVAYRPVKGSKTSVMAYETQLVSPAKSRTSSQGRGSRRSWANPPGETKLTLAVLRMTMAVMPRMSRNGRPIQTDPTTRLNTKRFVPGTSNLIHVPNMSMNAATATNAVVMYTMMYQT
ncbi:hypothetical protein H310_12716 [Aphanomyces invadans]|uniref:Uncharacterized protein n=1 Tax=Aphanomyces invadans TaxID=157072 RepID=A0A024TGV7_9STRA|nr:hypothetical protein H310_12716 [Aphanomyces invadans]ETV93288.1 hypothetical protein H310_12716 [Aphanomyces invadans]|eukprot:XP_008878123.1 hypothetical protein H310_12716 [Aphanomyces invadans]